MSSPAPQPIYVMQPQLQPGDVRNVQPLRRRQQLYAVRGSGYTTPAAGLCRSPHSRNVAAKLSAPPQYAQPAPAYTGPSRPLRPTTRRRQSMRRAAHYELPDYPDRAPRLCIRRPAAGALSQPGRAADLSGPRRHPDARRWPAVPDDRRPTPVTMRTGISRTRPP